MTVTSLALPRHAWRERGSWIARLCAGLLAFWGVGNLYGSFIGRYQLPAFSGWYNLVEGALYLAIAFAAWRRDRSLTRRAISVLLLVMGVRVVARLLWSPAVGLSAFGVVELVAYTSVGFGVWKAYEWGRRGCMILGLLSYGYRVASMSFAVSLFSEEILPDVPIRSLMLVGGILFALPSVALAIYGVLPSTRAHFAAAREATIRSSA